MKLYEKFASELINLIRNGTLKSYEKLPSVRQASRRFNISASTVLEAYYILETQGLIYAKDRSGFYVNAVFNTLKSPNQTEKIAQETTVEVSDFIFSILKTLKDPSMIQFGSAFPSPSLFPIADLSFCMNKAMQNIIHSPNDLISDVAMGNSELIRQIELRYLLSGIPLQDNELVITNGAMEALSLSLQAITKPGDLVAIESPVFYAILQILERLQLQAIEIPVDPITGMDLQALDHALKSFDIKAMVLMTSFQNPLGASLPLQDQQKLMNIIHTHQLPVITDDVYSELYYGKNPPISLKALDKSGLVIHCSSFSKCLAPGFRIGWVAGGAFSEKIERIKLMSTISPSMPSQLALSYYLKHKHYDRHLQKLRYVLALSQQKMIAAIVKYFPKNIAVTKPDGGYFLWIELDQNIDALDLYKKALAHKISIAPGAIFSASQKYQHCMRLNYGMEWTQVHETAMLTLGKLIKKISNS